MSSEHNNYSSGGIGFFGLLQLIFITLKLLRVINWSWLIVLLPALIFGAIVLLLILPTLIALIIGMWSKRNNNRKRVHKE